MRMENRWLEFVAITAVGLIVLALIFGVPQLKTGTVFSLQESPFGRASTLVGMNMPNGSVMLYEVGSWQAKGLRAGRKGSIWVW